MFYVYLLRSKKDGKYYIGCTEDLRRRFEEHNSLKCLSTKNQAPWELVYYEAYQSLSLARLRESKLKHHGKGLQELKKRLMQG